MASGGWWGLCLKSHPRSKFGTIFHNPLFDKTYQCLWLMTKHMVAKGHKSVNKNVRECIHTVREEVFTLNKFVLYKLTLLIDLYLFVCQKWSVLWLVRSTISVLLLTWICEIFCCKVKHLYFDIYLKTSNLINNFLLIKMFQYLSCFLSRLKQATFINMKRFFIHKNK